MNREEPTSLEPGTPDEFAHKLGELIDSFLETVEPVLILKIMGSVMEDVRAMASHAEIQNAFNQLHAAASALRHTPGTSSGEEVFLT